MVNNGSSLLPIGIKTVDGDFARGDVIKVCDMRNHEIARGITHYDSQDLQRIKGVKSEEVANILGFEHGTVVVHRDDLVVVA